MDCPLRSRLRVCDGDSLESDDTSEKASPIGPGETQIRSLCATGDVDWATFTLTEPSSVAIHALQVSAPKLLELSLLNADLTQLIASAGGNDPSTRIDRTCASGEALPAGTYYLRIQQPGPDTVARYDLSLDVEPCCGNGAVDPATAETCDDGNRVDGDCCSSACALESAPVPAIADTYHPKVFPSLA